MDYEIRWNNGENFEETAALILENGYRTYRKPKMAEQLSLDTEFSYSRSRALGNDKADIPDWLKKRLLRHVEIIAVATVLKAGTKRALTTRIDAADLEFKIAYQQVLLALECKPNQATENCLEALLARVDYEFYQAVIDIIPVWKRERAGVSRGHAAKEKNWLSELDNRPEWMERINKTNSEGWKVSSENIANILMASGKYDESDIPDKSTITRERNKRTKLQK
jgi:hypothetical protein